MNTQALPEGFIRFLVAAKRATYAAQGDDASTTPLLQDSKQLEYREREFLYRDIYVGLLRFVGQEVVYLKGRALWSMSYAGGVCADVERALVRPLYAFLRQALSAVPESLPLRGPAHFEDGAMRYALSCGGSLQEFHGVEEIYRDGACIYRIHVAGGMVA